MQIELNEVEQRICQFMAKKRGEESRKAGHTNTPYGRTQEDIDLEGFGAELAFCKMFNIYPDLTYNARVGGYDALTHKGYRIDVKDTTYQTGHLLVKKSKKHGQADIYALLVGKFPIYRFAGFIPEEDILKEEKLKDFGGYNQPGYAMTQNELKKDTEILE